MLIQSDIRSIEIETGSQVDLRVTEPHGVTAPPDVPNSSSSDGRTETVLDQVDHKPSGEITPLAKDEVVDGSSTSTEQSMHRRLFREAGDVVTIHAAFHGSKHPTEAAS